MNVTNTISITVLNKNLKTEVKSPKGEIDSIKILRLDNNSFIRSIIV